MHEDCPPNIVYCIYFRLQRFSFTRSYNFFEFFSRSIPSSIISVVDFVVDSVDSFVVITTPGLLTYFHLLLLRQCVLKQYMRIVVHPHHTVMSIVDLMQTIRARLNDFNVFRSCLKRNGPISQFPQPEIIIVVCAKLF